jgi:hypothetical protein
MPVFLTQDLSPLQTAAASAASHTSCADIAQTCPGSSRRLTLQRSSATGSQGKQLTAVRILRRDSQRASDRAGSCSQFAAMTAAAGASLSPLTQACFASCRYTQQHHTQHAPCAGRLVKAHTSCRQSCKSATGKPAGRTRQPTQYNHNNKEPNQHAPNNTPYIPT